MYDVFMFVYIYECILIIIIQYFCTTDEDLWVETFCLLNKIISCYDKLYSNLITTIYNHDKQYQFYYQCLQI